MRSCIIRTLLLAAALLAGCAAHPPEDRQPLLVASAPKTATASQAPAPTVAPTVASPIADEDDPPSAIDEAPPPPFDPSAWLAQRGVTDPIPEDHHCNEALPTTP